MQEDLASASSRSELAQVNGELSGGETPRKRLLDRVLSVLEE